MSTELPICTSKKLIQRYFPWNGYPSGIYYRLITVLIVSGMEVTGFVNGDSGFPVSMVMIPDKAMQTAASTSRFFVLVPFWYVRHLRLQEIEESRMVLLSSLPSFTTFFVGWTMGFRPTQHVCEHWIHWLWRHMRMFGAFSWFGRLHIWDDLSCKRWCRYRLTYAHD